MNDQQIAVAEQLLRDMEAAFSRNDVDGVVECFADDATVESYIVTRVFNRKQGICRGRDEIRQLIAALLQRGLPWGSHGPPLVRGDRVAVEYLRASSDSETFSVDIIEIEDGKIQSLRAYAGWRAIQGLTGEARDR